MECSGGVLSVVASSVAPMLVIKVELWPGGWSTNAEELGRAAAASVAESDGVADYVAVLHDRAGQHRAGQHSAVHLTSHNREARFWPLVARIAASSATAADRGPLESRWVDLAELISERMYDDA